jgi:hypothetical protein
LIGRFDLIHHRLVCVLPGEQSRDRGQNRKNSCAQGRPRNPRSAAVFRALLYLLMQMLERNFCFFHAIKSEVCDPIQGGSSAKYANYKIDNGAAGVASDMDG